MERATVIYMLLDERKPRERERGMYMYVYDLFILARFIASFTSECSTNLNYNDRRYRIVILY